MPLSPSSSLSLRSRGLLVPLAFVLFNFALRYALIGVNQGVYTDGILQITQFERADSFWPPLYTAWVWLFRRLGADPIWAGRFVSCLCASLLIVPIWTVARRWGGERTAIFAAALYTCSPMALRWSVRVMTDVPFLLFFHGACALLLSRWTRGGRPCARSLVWATLLAVAATLTRYQGVMLAPFVAWELSVAFRRRLHGRWAAFLTQALWLALPAWLAWQRFGHIGQVLERQGAGGWESLINYLYYFETFVFLIPYVLTLPVMCFLAVGLVLGAPGGSSDGAPVRWLLLYIALAVLVAQSVFQSFQSRYLLPLLPLGLTVAGAGMARFEARWSRSRRLRLGFVAVATCTLLLSLGFGFASVFLQRGAFGDIYAAGRMLRESNLSPSTPVYSNEVYKPGMSGIKMGFALGREVGLIPDLDPRVREAMPPGSIVALHSAYGGPAAQRAFASRLAGRYRLQPVPGGVFHSSLVPLLPDIMEEPVTHQNPLAWLLRYRRQRFTTRLYIAGKPKE